MFWPPNSPDLSAIEPPWRYMKWQQGKKGPVRSRKRLTKIWRQLWKEFPPKLLQRFVERVQGNIEWVIRLKGGNEYQEGTKPPELTQEEQERLNSEIREFLDEPEETEEGSDPWQDIVDAIEALEIDDGVVEADSPVASGDDDVSDDVSDEDLGASG